MIWYTFDYLLLLSSKGDILFIWNNDKKNSNLPYSIYPLFLQFNKQKNTTRIHNNSNSNSNEST